jgi:hypothetical protein
MGFMQLLDTEKNIGTIVQAIKQLAQGRSVATGEVTLRANQTTTTVTAQTCGLDSVPSIEPMTATAAIAKQTAYFSAINRGSFVVTHANTADVDKTFRWKIQG